MSTRNFQPGDTYGIGFTIKSSTGALVAADSTPTGTLYRNGVADGAVTVTISTSATGVYAAGCTIPGTYAAGDRVSLLVNATIGGVATGEFVDHARLVGWPNAVGSAGSLVTVGTGTGQVNPTSGKLPATLAAADVTGNLPVDLQTIKTQAVTAAAGVTFPTSIGTSTYAGGAVASVTAAVTVGTNNDKTGYSLTTAPPTAAAIATAVWTDATSSDFTTSGTPGKVLVGQLGGAFTGTTSVFTAPALANAPSGTGASAATIAAAVWDQATTGHTTAGTFGANLDAAISTRSTFAGGAVASVTGNVGGNVVGSVGSVTAPVTAGTVSDKAGYKLASDGLDAIAIEAGVNARQALSPILAAAAGTLSGAGTGTIVVKGGNVSTTRITATTDASGNRSAVTLALPS